MIFVLSFFVMLFIVSAMAVGAMAGREPLKGSCGGLAAVGIDGRCEICGEDPNSCDESKELSAEKTSDEASAHNGKKGAVQARGVEYFDATKQDFAGQDIPRQDATQ